MSDENKAPFFTAEDFMDESRFVMTRVQTAVDKANAKVQALIDENEKLKAHYDNCQSEKLVTFSLEIQSLRSLLKEAMTLHYAVRSELTSPNSDTEWCIDEICKLAVRIDEALK